MRRLSTPRQRGSCPTVPANMSLLCGGFGTRREAARRGRWSQPPIAPDGAPQKHSPPGRRFSRAQRHPATLRRGGRGAEGWGGAGRRPPGGGGGRALRAGEGSPSAAAALSSWIRSGARARSPHCSESDDFTSRVSQTPGAQKGGRSVRAEGPPCLLGAGAAPRSGITLAGSTFILPSPKF